MNATVTDVKFNQQLGSYTVTKLYVRTDTGESKDYSIFTNAKFHNVVTQLKKGDQISIKMEKKGKYWNVADVEKLAGGSGGAASQTTSAGNSGKSYSEGGGTKDIAIARAVALKAGVEVATAMLNNGLFKKTIKPAAFVEEVLGITKRFEGYCTLADDLSDLEADFSSIDTGDSEDYDEVPFPA